MYIQLENGLNEILKPGKLNFLMFLGFYLVISDQIRQKYFKIFCHYDHIYQFFQVLLVLVDSLECIDSKTTKFSIGDPFQGDLIGREAKIVAIISIIDQIGKKFFDIFGHYGYIFQLFQVLLAIVDSLKCMDSKTTQFFVADPYLYMQTS